MRRIGSGSGNLTRLAVSFGFITAAELMLATSALLAQNCPQTGQPPFSSPPFCSYSGDPQLDKEGCLAFAPMPIFLKNGGVQIGGTLWPTLIEVECFASQHSPYDIAPITITAGTDNHDPAGSGRGHLEGYKVDLQINNKSDTYNDPLSLYVLANTQPYFPSSPTPCRGDGASLFIDPYVVVYAMEFPTPENSPGHPDCGPPKIHNPLTYAPHWDVTSSFDTITSAWDASPGLQVQVGQTVALSPTAYDGFLDKVPMQPWMFTFVVPSPNFPIQTVQVDNMGNLTGLDTNLDGSDAQVPVYASAGGFCINTTGTGTTCQGVDRIMVTVSATQPPPGGPLCSGPPTQWAGCWNWDPASAGWIWYPNPNQPGGQPPGPPPSGAPLCPPGPAPVAVPCWEWNGRGWVLVPAGGTSTTTTTSGTITPVASLDPNDISGPPGVGPFRYISGASPAPYTLFFENEPTATAPAQEVVITDQIDLTRFDLSSVVLGPITFPGIPGVSPPSLPLVAISGFSSQVDLRPTTNLLVNVSATVNSTGLLTWTLQSIDPSTGQPPTDPTAGFLPPGGDGSVAFSASLKSSLATGSLVTDQGTVVFDANAPILTPIWSNTIDQTSPTSQMSSLPPYSVTPSFPVQWSGTDVGAGVQDFTVYVSDNGSSFTVFRANTSSTSAIFVGQPGHTYGFYSIDRDLVGNVEGPKSAAESTTQIAPTLSALSVNLEISKHGFELSGQFTLAATSGGINPVTDPVILQLGGFSIAIPPGSFVVTKKGGWSFEGTIGGVRCEFKIRPLGNGTFRIDAEGDGVDLTGLNNPIAVTLAIGDNTGTTLVSAEH